MRTDGTYEKHDVVVSIITPLYNAEDYIERNICSIRSQGFQKWEHIIVDDRSVDKGPEIVKKWAKIDTRIKFRTNEVNSGPAVTRNRAIKLAKGRYIAFLDSDDQWESNKLEIQLNFMQKQNTPLSFSYYKQIDEKGRALGVVNNIPERVDYSSTLKDNKIGCLTVIYDTEYFGKVFMPLIQRRQDYALWLKLLKKVDYAYCIPKTLATYTIRNNSISSNKLKLIKYNWEVYRKIEGFSFLKSTYYLACIIFNKIKKERRNKREK